MEDKGIIETIEDSFLGLVDGAVEYTPKILAFLLLLIVGWIVARLISKLVSKIVDKIETSKPVLSTLQSLGVKSIDVDGVVGMFTRWAIFLVFLSAAVDVLGLPVLSDTFNALVGFVPNILAAAVVVGLSFVAANALHDIVFESAKKAGLKMYKKLAIATKVTVLIFGLPLAAAQLGFDLSLIINNITVIVAGVALAFGLAFGLGGKEVAGKIVNDLYNNWKK